MSRLGKKSISLPKGVTLKQADGVITISGPKGNLTLNLRPEVTVTVEGDQITVTSNKVTDKAQHIAAAAKQQSVASEDVARNMERISGLIEENTQSAQLAWKATEDLSKTAEELRALVQRFSVSG